MYPLDNFPQVFIPPLSSDNKSEFASEKLQKQQQKKILKCFMVYLVSHLSVR